MLLIFKVDDQRDKMYICVCVLVCVAADAQMDDFAPVMHHSLATSRLHYQEMTSDRRMVDATRVSQNSLFAEAVAAMAGGAGHPE